MFIYSKLPSSYEELLEKGESSLKGPLKSGELKQANVV